MLPWKKDSQTGKALFEEIRKALLEMDKIKREKKGRAEWPCGSKVRVEEVSDTDPREKLRGEWGVRAARELREGELLGPFAGTLCLERRLTEWDSLRRTRYMYSLSVPPDGTAHDIVIDPWNRGNQLMFMNDFRKDPMSDNSSRTYEVGDLVLAEFRRKGKGGKWFRAVVEEVKADGKYVVGWEDGDKKDRVKTSSELQAVEPQNVIFLHVKWRGWPLVLVVAKTAVAKNTELLIDYGLEYWKHMRRAQASNEVWQEVDRMVRNVQKQLKKAGEVIDLDADDPPVPLSPCDSAASTHSTPARRSDRVPARPGHLAEFDTTGLGDLPAASM